EVETLERDIGARSEEADRVPRPLCFEELPDGAHLHEFGSLLLHVLDRVIELERLRVPLGEQFFEIALKAKVPAVEHERINVAPDLRQVRDSPDTAIRIRRGRNRNIRVHLRPAELAGRNNNRL